MFIAFLVTLYALGVLGGSQGEVNVEKWKALHPYQADKAPDVPITKLTADQEASLESVM